MMASNRLFTTTRWLLALGFPVSAFAQASSDNPLQLSPPNVMLEVADLRRESEWYENVLGFREIQPLRHWQHAEVRTVAIPRSRFDLVWHKGSRRPPSVPYQIGYLHISFKSATLDEDYQWLTDHGVKVDLVRDPKSNVLRKVNIHDPEGNEIELKPLDRDTTMALGDDACLAPTASPTPGESPLRNVIASEVTLIVADLNAEAAWFENALGFHESMHSKQPPEVEVRAVDIPGYRVFLLWHRGSIRPQSELNQQGYVHIAFQTTAFKEDYRWLTAHGIKVELIRDPRSHVLQIMRLHDPEGNEIEIEDQKSFGG